MKNKKLGIILGVILLLVVVGVSYAWLTTTILGKKEYILKAGELDLVLDETSNGLMIEDDIPVEDIIGLASDGATFSVRNNSNHNICYQIYLDDTDLLEGQIRVDDRFVKYSLDKDSVVGEAKVLSSGRLIDETEIRAGSSINYKLRLWFNSEIDGEIAGQLFKGRLRIEAMQCGNNLPIMKAYKVPTEETSDYHAESYRTKVTSIITKKDTIIPDNVVESWDVSAAGDNSVIAYALDDGAGGYAITIGGNGGILANEDSSYSFAEFTAAKTIDVTYLDTSMVNSMYAMFGNCRSLVSLDLSHFDTSKVSTMLSMFIENESLVYLNVSNFDTRNVGSMSYIFKGCSSLTSLDLRSFTATHYMKQIFMNCTKLASVFVNAQWDISASDASQLFENCGVDHVTVIN